MKLKSILTMRFVVMLATVFISCVGIEKAEGAKNLAEKPNIIFIMTDDQGAWTPSFTGHKGAFTPNLDRLKTQGMEFTHVYVTTPVCSPSRATLMTSRYSTEVGIPDWISNPKIGLEPKFTSWPTLLQKAGYKTALIGKWHLGHKQERHHPKKHGYDHFMGFRNGGCYGKDTKLEVNGKMKIFPGLLVDNLTNDAMEFIERHKEKPFCISLHFRAPHGPFLPVSDEVWEKHKKGGHLIPRDRADLKMKAATKMMKEYCAAVSGIDYNLGRLMQKLDELNLSDNTILIFTSDHGYNVGHHGLQGKGNGGWLTTGKGDSYKWPNITGRKRPNMFDTSLRVPFVVRWPKVIKAGSECPRTIDFTDFYPTLCKLAGVEIPSDVKIQGNDFSPFLEGKTIKWSDEFYSEYDLTERRSKTHMRCWRTPKWKLMVDFNNPGRVELYHLEKDPNEDNNLFESTAPEVVKVKQELFDKIIGKMKAINDPVLTKVDSWKSVSGF